MCFALPARNVFELHAIAPSPHPWSQNIWISNVVKKEGQPLIRVILFIMNDQKQRFAWTVPQRRPFAVY